MSKKPKPKLTSKLTSKAWGPGTGEAMLDWPRFFKWFKKRWLLKYRR